MEIPESKGVKGSCQLPVPSRQVQVRCIGGRQFARSRLTTRLNSTQSHKSPLEGFYVGRAQVPSDFVTVECEGAAEHPAALRAATADEIVDRLQGDPWTAQDLLRVSRISLWSLRLGSPP